MYDFEPDPSEFPYIKGKFSFLFCQCTIFKNILCREMILLCPLMVLQFLEQHIVIIFSCKL
jgi:hypothetical protein